MSVKSRFPGKAARPQGSQPKWRSAPPPGDPIWLFMAIASAAFLLAAWTASVRQAATPPPASGRRLASDANGRRAPIDFPFGGAAFLATTLGDYLFVTHRPDAIVLAPAYSPPRDRLLGRVFGGLIKGSSVRNNGTGASNLETLLALRPGAVFSWYFQRPALERVGLPVIGVGAQNGRFSLFDDARAYAGALRLDGAAERIIAAYKDQMAATGGELGPDIPRPGVLGLGFFGDGRMAVWIASNPATRLIELAGAKNASAKRVNPPWIDAEEVLRIDPDILILREGANNRVDPASFMSDARWRALKCVRNRRVYTIPKAAGSYFQGIVEDPLFVRWLAELVQPDRLRPKVRAMMREAYSRELNYRLSDVELDDMLQTKANGASSFYERFLLDAQ